MNRFKSALFLITATGMLFSSPLTVAQLPAWLYWVGFWLDWIAKVDWIGLDRVEWDWIGLSWIGLAWVGFYSIGLDSVGFGWMRLGWGRLEWVGLDLIGLGCVGVESTDQARATQKSPTRPEQPGTSPNSPTHSRTHQNSHKFKLKSKIMRPSEEKQHQTNP